MVSKFKNLKIPQSWWLWFGVVWLGFTLFCRNSSAPVAYWDAIVVLTVVYHRLWLDSQGRRTWVSEHFELKNVNNLQNVESCLHFLASKCPLTSNGMHYCKSYHYRKKLAWQKFTLASLERKMSKLWLLWSVTEASALRCRRTPLRDGSRSRRPSPENTSSVCTRTPPPGSGAVAWWASHRPIARLTSPSRPLSHPSNPRIPWQPSN